MSRELLEKVREAIVERSIPVPFPPATLELVEKAELTMSIKIPALLRECYLSFGNGGFGPGLGIIGIHDGHRSDFGDLVGTYRELDGDLSMAVPEARHVILPFCEWGCSTFSCVRCDDSLMICTYEGGAVIQEGYSLDRFFEIWLGEVDIPFRGQATSASEKEFVNPFTGRKEKIRKSGLRD